MSTLNKSAGELPVRGNASWNAIMNYVERKVAQGFSLPWFPGSIPGSGSVPAGVGLHDANGRLTFICTDWASATIWSRFVNEEFA